jgi:hypothetical protein
LNDLRAPDIERDMAFQLLDRRLGEPDPVSRSILRLGIAVGSVLLVTGLISAYRAWVQVYDVTLHVTSDTLRAGMTVSVAIVTSGRTPVDTWPELEQDGRLDTLARWLMPNNGDPATDPRPRHATYSLALRPASLESFSAGNATLRATARGRPQWTRLPPDEVRERRVSISP